MEYLPGGQVQWADAQHKPLLSLQEIRRIIRDVILGLEYCGRHVFALTLTRAKILPVSTSPRNYTPRHKASQPSMVKGSFCCQDH